MSRYLGAVRQAAYVVNDLDRTLKYWTEELGIGPFFAMRHIQFDAGYRYRGRPSPSPTFSAALGYSGGMQIEIIQQHDEQPSPYRDFLLSGRTGFHHWSSMLNPREFDEVAAERIKRNTPIAHQGTFMGGAIRFIYFDTDPENNYGGMYFEIADFIGSPMEQLMQSFEAASRDWDGSDPVREVATS